jgi:tRNA(Ile)-lysidine synthase
MPPRVAVAVSGGRDSMALLHCLARAGRERDVEVWALHVHHGLMADADAWAAFVERTCQRWSVPFAMQRLAGRPARGDSVEAWARAGRYAALAAMARDAGCSTVTLAHHRGDQAETFLLQALRGAGAAGLAAMPARSERDGLTWVRPWLEQPREAIEAYVRTHRIAFIDDGSNDDERFARNRLRRQVMPVLREAFGEAEAALAAAASRAAHARALIDEIARADLAAAADNGSLRLAAWQALSPPRRRECLRAWLAERLAAGATTEALLDRLMAELPRTPPARWPVEGGELQRYRGRLVHTAAPPANPRAAWPADANATRPGTHAVPGLRAALRVRASSRTGGLPLALLQGAQWRARAGAERFQRAAGTPPRSLKKQFQAAGVPAWSRDAPLLFAADGTLLFVPGLGTDARALAAPGTPRVVLEWLRDDR